MYPHNNQRDFALANIAGWYAETGDNKQVARLFTRLPEMMHGLDSFEERLMQLAEVGFRYEKAGMKVDGRIRDVLGKLIKDWTEDED